MAIGSYGQNSYPSSGDAKINGVTVGIGSGSITTNTVFGRASLFL